MTWLDKVQQQEVREGRRRPMLEILGWLVFVVLAVWVSHVLVWR